MAKSAGSDLPDPETLASWESAFAAYPISAVRRLDQTLHGDLDANRDRLRTLVGFVSSKASSHRFAVLCMTDADMSDRSEKRFLERAIVTFLVRRPASLKWTKTCAMWRHN